MASTRLRANISEAKASLSKLVADVESGAEVIISRAGKPVAKLVAYSADAEPRDLSASPWAGQVRIRHDFDELPADFMQHFEKDSVSN